MFLKAGKRLKYKHFTKYIGRVIKSHEKVFNVINHQGNPRLTELNGFRVPSGKGKSL